MLNPKQWGFLDFETYTDDSGYEKISKYLLYYNEEMFINEDLFECLSVISCDSKKVVFVKRLNILCALCENKIINMIDVNKKYFFYDSNHPLYFTINGYEFRDYNSLQIKNFLDLKAQINKYSTIDRFPKTLAGFVREDLRNIQNKALEKSKEKIFKSDYKDRLQKAYTGGDCGKLAGLLEGDMYSFDITSSYPAMLYYMKYPMGDWRKINGNYITEKDKRNPYIITTTFFNINAKSINCSIMTHWVENEIEDKYGKPINGYVISDEGERIVSGSLLTVTCTSLDYENIKKWYDYDSEKIECIYTCSRWDYLPFLTREKIREYYFDKELSRDPIKKRKLNIIYGVFCNHKNPYRLPWDTKDYEEEVSVFPFQIGVFCSAYARSRLNDLLYELRETACYWDTDCIKGCVEDMEFVYQTVEKHNELMRSLYCEDEEWNLGCWKDEGIHYMEVFATKKYIKDGVPTVAGATIDWDVERDGICTKDTIVKNAYNRLGKCQDGYKFYSDDLDFSRSTFQENHY